MLLLTKRLLFGLLFSSVVLVSGCGFLGKNSEKTTGTPEMQSEPKESSKTLEQYGFNNFELEIDVQNEEVIDVEYEANDQSDAKYKNKLENIDLKNLEAQNTLNTFFTQLQLTKDTDETTVKQHILQWFKIDEYSSFELEVRFQDGTTLTINDFQ